MIKREKSSGIVYLVGAGPGDPDLITVKGRRLIEQCDALVYDYLVSEELQNWVKPGCELHYVGKKGGFHSISQEEIEALLLKLSGEGKTVVRLKGGDPFIFGRGGEEAQTLHRAGVAFEVIPAVTAALGCAAYAGLPLTHRDWSSAVTFISGHEAPDRQDKVNWEAHARSGATLVLYMSMARLEKICSDLIAYGRAAETAASVVQWGTTARQRTVHGNLGNIAWKAGEAGLGAPAVVIIGEVALLGGELDWFDPSI